MRGWGSDAVDRKLGLRTAMLVLVALLGVATLVGLVVTLRGADAKRDEALRAQAHSYDMMILARSLTGTIARAEASLGRYVISADERLGRLYYEEWTLAGSQLDRLDAITRESRAQHRRIELLRAAYNRRGEELSLTALSTRYRKNRQAFARFYQARETATLTTINRTLDEIIRTERALLDARSREATRSVVRSSRIAGGLAFFGMLLVTGAALLGWLTVRAVGQRAEAEAQAEEERERSEALQRAVSAATDELRVQEAKLRQVQKMQAIGELTGGIAHDFNNMLAVTLGGLELARRNLYSDPAAALRQIDSAREGADRAAALTRRLLAFSREEALKPEVIEAGALVAGMSDLLDRTLGDGVTVEIRDESAGWHVHADRVQLENALLNLAVNARDAMDGRGTLSITIGRGTLAAGEVGTCAAGEYLTLAVADTGCGMTPEVAERVFEPFFTTKAVGRGTGLGLSQLFALVDQLGGHVALDTAPGAGTTVTLHLPRAAAEPRIVEIVEAPSVPAEPAKLRILVVEDDPRVLAATTAALEELGHQPVPCDDPFAAPAMLEDEADAPVDLILSDVLMPRRTGPEMIAALSPRFAHLPVLFVTGFAGETGAEALDGAHVLRKPFTLAALARAVTGATTSGRGPDQIAAE
jgi:signal transduction histidine kinase/CheY-like chemotaxis protein